MEKLQIIGKKNNNVRNPNIDFIRIIGMLAIVIQHLLYHGGAIIKFNRYNEIKFLYISSLWHVSSFGIISGMIGNKSHKYSNLIYLWITTVFYSIVFYRLSFIKKIEKFKDSLIISMKNMKKN